MNINTVSDAVSEEFTLEELESHDYQPQWVGGIHQPHQVMGDEAAGDAVFEDLAPEALRSMYREMLLVRTLDNRCVNLHRQGRIGFFVPSTGEEAAQIGSAWALQPSDWVYTAYREIGVALHRGFPIQTLLCQLFGNCEDLLKGRQMPNHYGSADVRFTVASSPVGTQIPQAVGAAYAARFRGESSAVLTYFGDGATSTGDFHAGMNLAGVQQLGVVFFCKNNGWAISLPRERQTASQTLAQKAEAYGFEGVRVDGNDVLAVYQVTAAALAKARRGDGPTMIEAITYRVGPHSTADDPRRYRSADELERWKANDPLARFRRYLTIRGFWCEADEERAQADLDRKIAAAVDAREYVSPPELDSLFEDVYQDLPWHLAEQRDEILQREAS